MGKFFQKVKGKAQHASYWLGALVASAMLMNPVEAFAGGQSGTFSTPSVGLSGSSSGLSSNATVNSLYYYGEIIVYILFGFSGMATVGFLIFNAYKLMSSGGNPQKRQEAVHGLMYVGLGALITFGAWTLAGVLQDAASQASSGGIAGALLSAIQ